MSSKIEITPFHEDHLSRIELKDVYCDHDLPTRMRALQANPNAHTISFLSGSNVLGIVGLIVFWPGVAEAWSLTSERVKDHPHAFHRAVLRQLKQGAEWLHLHRIQMSVKADFKEGIRWANSLGFHPEALLKSYGADRADHFLFVRFS